MAIIEPGTYQIINFNYNVALSTQESYDSEFAIVGMKMPDEPIHNWRISHSGEFYQVQSIDHGGYLMAESAEDGAKVRLGNPPTLWEIICIPDEKDTYVMKLAGGDILLEMHDFGFEETYTTMLFYNAFPFEVATGAWKFKSVCLPDIDKPVRENSEPSTATKDELITQLIDQIAQKDKRVLELTEQVSSQSQEIEELRREIGNKKRQIEEKDREVRYMFTRLMLREPDQSRVSGVHDSGGGPLNQINSKSDVDMLSEKLDRLESLVLRLVDKGGNKTSSGVP